MSKIRFGTFIPPIHPVGENPTLCLERDMDLIVHLDKLGYDEAWIGEHHSAGTELLASPELVIAAVAERTKYIKLGTEVNSLPYHHPPILADRIMQVHHKTRGRAMFGAGPGALVSDAKMMGIDPNRQRDMMEEALACILRLFRGETVTHKAA
jgi:limonene 1,2-monooxygenase